MKKNLTALNRLTLGVILNLLVINFSSCTHTSAKSIVSNKSKAFGVFKFKEHGYYFGKIKDGDTVRHRFDFINVGKDALIINDISTTCGCTIVNWSKKPVPPNDSGFVDVQFSKHHDAGLHQKPIIITANTVDPYTVLNIRAYVTK